MRRALVVALTALALLAVAGCGGSAEPDDDASPTIGEDTSTPASPSPTRTKEPSPSPTETGVPFDDKGYDVIPATIAAQGAEEQAVAQAWLDYWAYRLKAYGEVKVDPRQLGAVATGRAASDVIGYVAELEGRGDHTVGDMRIGVSDITVRGRAAGLDSCFESKSIDVDATGQPTEPLAPYIVLSGVATKSAAGWRIADASVVAERECQP